MSIHGYVAYRPKGYAKSWLQAAKTVLVQYKAWNEPMTVRQIFYRLVAEFGYDKTEGAYGSLGGYIARSRRAYMHGIIKGMQEGLDHDESQRAALDDPILIPFSWIRDEKGTTLADFYYDSVDDFMESVKSSAENVRLNRADGQARQIEMWCEGMSTVPIMRGIAAPYGVRVSSGGGYDSVTAKHKLAQRVVADFEENGRGTTVLHIGDFDPSGEGLYETLRDDVSEMVWHTAARDLLVVERMALTEEQVLEMEVETAPPKPLDSRSRGFVARHPEIVRELGTENITAQLEALKPPELKELIGNALSEHIDRDAYQAVLDEEKETQRTVLEALELD